MPISQRTAASSVSDQVDGDSHTISQLRQARIAADKEKTRFTNAKRLSDRTPIAEILSLELAHFEVLKPRCDIIAGRILQAGITKAIQLISNRSRPSHPTTPGRPRGTSAVDFDMTIDVNARLYTYTLATLQRIKALLQKLAVITPRLPHGGPIRRDARARPCDGIDADINPERCSPAALARDAPPISEGCGRSVKRNPERILRRPGFKRPASMEAGDHVTTPFTNTGLEIAPVSSLSTATRTAKRSPAAHTSGAKRAAYST